MHEEHGRAVPELAVADQAAVNAHPRVRRSWLPVDGAWLHTEVIGPDGPGDEPIVLLHGLGVSAASLGPLAGRLARRHEVVSCDLPGFGDSPSPEIWDTARIAEGVRRVLDDRGLARAVLAGHSYGCHVAACLAARHPERVAALVLLSPAFDRRFGSPLAQMLRLTVNATMERPASGRPAASATTCGPGRAASSRPCARRSRIPLDDLVAAARCPVLIVRGSRDALTTGRWADELRRSAAGAGAGRRRAAGRPRARVTRRPAQPPARSRRSWRPCARTRASMARGASPPG